MGALEWGCKPTREPALHASNLGPQGDYTGGPKLAASGNENTPLHGPFSWANLLRLKIITKGGCMENDSEIIPRQQQSEGIVTAAIAGFVAGVVSVLTLLKILSDD